MYQILMYRKYISSLWTLYVTCSGETGNESEQQVSHKVGINSAGYIIQYNHSGHSYLETAELHFNNKCIYITTYQL